MKHPLRRLKGLGSLAAIKTLKGAVHLPHLPKLAKLARLSHVAAHAKTEPLTFDSVYKRYQKPILRFVRGRITNEEVASEVTQEIFLKVHRFLDSYEEQYAFSTWLWTIARNTVADHLRGRAVGGHHHVDGEISPDDLPSPNKCPEAHTLKRDERRIFLNVMRGLTRAQRRVLRLRMIHQLSYPEISRKLGISLTAVKNLAYRAKLAIVGLGERGAIADLGSAGVYGAEV